MNRRRAGARRRAKAREQGKRILYVARHAESASILEKRSGFQQVLADARAGKFGCLIVDRMNRFSRSEDLSEPLQVLRDLKLLGVQVIFATRNYDDGPMGQMQQTLDAYASATEQENRRKASLDGKRGRAQRHHQPLPGARAPYGYVWADHEKTRLDFDPQVQAVVARIWTTFLDGTTTATLRGMARQLCHEQQMPPRVYQGFAGEHSGRWNPSAIDHILRNPVYWGKPVTFAKSKYEDAVPLPVYGPTYVTPAEAARVHAHLGIRRRTAHRRSPYAALTLLDGDLVRCGYCKGAMGPKPAGRRNQDGTRGLYYRCQCNARYDSTVCKGVVIQSATLDYGVMLTLDENLASGDFLDRLFAAWDRDAETAMGEVRSVEAMLKDTEQKIANQSARLDTLAPDDPLAESVEVRVRLLATTLPGLRERHAKARDAVTTARHNPGLRDELKEWFSAWMLGFSALPRSRQRDFLHAIQARVEVWREEDRTPRALLRIGLPTAPLSLPAPPSSTLAQDPETGAWTVDVDTDQGAKVAAQWRHIATHGLVVDGEDVMHPAPDTRTPEQVMADVQQELPDRQDDNNRAANVSSGSWRSGRASACA
jgi:DNA invertase Pin-like site-specific DNA recombinase